MEVHMTNRIRLLSLVLLLVAFSGCSAKSTPRVEPPPDQLLRFDQPLKLTGAFWDGHNLYIRYQDSENTLYYGYANEDTQQSLSIHTDWLPIYQIFPVDAARYEAIADDYQPLLTVGSQAWEKLKELIVERLTPATPRQGIVLNVRDKEFFLYRESDDSITARDMLEKPVDIPLVANYRFEALGDTIFDHLEAFLAANNIRARTFIFATGETGPYARPFAFLDMNERELGLLSLEPFTFGSMPNSVAVSGGKAIFHTVRSYFFECINRPVSFVARLVFFVTDTAWDISRGLYYSYLRFPFLDNKNIPPLHGGDPMDLAAWEKHLDDMFGATRSSGTMSLLVDGDNFFPAYVDAVIAADASIKVRTYIFDRDDYGVKMADLLKRRAESVDVQVMADGIGILLAQNKAAGTMPADHKAPMGITAYLARNSPLRVRSLTNPWMAGDHTKTTIVDSSRAFIGGMNIGREYRWEWHDLMIETQGPIAKILEYEFDKTWVHGSVLGDFVYLGYLLKNPRPELETSGFPIRVLRTLPYRSEIYRAQLQAVRNARQYIFIENAYFSDIGFIFELVKARLRGVDVRVIIPMEGNHGIMNKSNVVAANTLLKYGARVFVFPGMSHVKAAIYDGWACLGSANFDKLSFRVNKELNLATSYPGFIRELTAEVFIPDFAESVELTKPLPKNWGNSFAFIVASQL